MIYKETDMPIVSRMSYMQSNSSYSQSWKKERKQVASIGLSLVVLGQECLACSPISFKVMWKMFVFWYPERMN